MGRPKKVVEKTKRIKLTKEQQSYAKLIKDVEKHLALKKPLVEALDAKITKIKAKYDAELKKLNEQRSNLAGETRNLEEAKKNLEGVLAKVPPPPEWDKFNKIVYEYHYHYHPCGCQALGTCPHCHVYPWWYYWNGGSYVYYPTVTQVYTNIPNPTTGTFVVTQSPNMQVTTCDALPQTYVTNATSGTSGLLLSANTGITSSFTTSGSSISGNFAVAQEVSNIGDANSAVMTLTDLGFFNGSSPTIS